MAILIIEGASRPEFDTVAALPINSSPPPIGTKPRRRRPALAQRIETGALRAMWDEVDDSGVYLPSPETIAAECAAIRAGWSENEYRQRAAMMPNVVDKSLTSSPPGTWRHWTVPTVRIEGDR